MSVLVLVIAGRRKQMVLSAKTDAVLAAITKARGMLPQDIITEGLLQKVRREKLSLNDDTIRECLEETFLDARD